MDQMRSKRSLSCRWLPLLQRSWRDGGMVVAIEHDWCCQANLSCCLQVLNIKRITAKLFFLHLFAEKIGDDCSNMMIPVT